MCGINGYISRTCNIVDLETMNQAIAHRGPDSNGVWSKGNVGLAHVRLSILDLSERGNQPFVKNGFVIVFNGEIYNFRQIRDELKSKCKFTTNSDTEVVLEAWRYWGIGCLEKLRGMFAFAIYDEHSQKTWIVRDPFGIKPLFYYPLRTGGLAFASELKALEAVYRNEFTVNETAIAASLLYVWLPENTCIWNEVTKLPPGYFIQAELDGRYDKQQYWQPESLLLTDSQPIKNETETISALNNTLLDSVKAHLVADVPINAFLSGGLDSSLLVAMARSELESLDCYTIKFSEHAKKAEAMTDDAYYAAMVAKHLGVKLNTIEVEPDLALLLPKIVSYLDEPIGDSAAINTLLICEAARQQGVKVLLSGMGADELFGGYRKHYANLLAQRYRSVPAILRKLLEALVTQLPVNIAGRGIVPIRWAKRFLSFASQPEADSFLRSYSYYNCDELGRLLPEIGTSSFNTLRVQHHKIFNSAAQRSLLDKMCYTDLNMFMVSLNETYTDRASMAASTEVRVPFIDKHVVDLAFNIDPALKIKKGTSKYVLKKVAEKWLPNKIIYRPKSPFSLPLRAWVRGQLADMVDDYVLSSKGLAGRAWFNNLELRNLVENDRAGRCDNAQHIWQLLTLEQWFRNHGI